MRSYTYLEELGRRRAKGDIDTQTDAQEVLQVLTELLGRLERRRAVRCDEVERLERLLVQVGRLVLNHFDRHDAQ